MFVRTAEDKRILIDGGSNSEIIKYLSDILPFYTRRIDMVIATSDLGKNVGGLIDVVDRYKVDKVYLPAYTLENLNLSSSTDQIYDTFVQLSKDKETVSVDKIERGRILYLDSVTKLEVLFPTDPKEFVYSKSSAPEFLFNISYGSNNILFAGNATPKIQKYLASSTSLVRVTNTDVLIVSHSALPQSFAQNFIDRFRPKSLIYSKNISQSTKKTNSAKSKTKDPIEYLSSENRFNIKERGIIKIQSDGRSVEIK